MKGTLGVERLSLRELCEGNLLGDFITVDSGRYVKRLWTRGSLSIRAPLGNLEGGSYIGDVER